MTMKEFFMHKAFTMSALVIAGIARSGWRVVCYITACMIRAITAIATAIRSWQIFDHEWLRKELPAALLHALVHLFVAFVLASLLGLSFKLVGFH